MALSKNNAEEPKKPTAQEMAIINRYMSGKIKPTVKKPVDKVSRAQLVKLATPEKKPEISAEMPSLRQVSVSGGQDLLKKYEPIPQATASSTVVENAMIKAKSNDLYSSVLDNTIKLLARNKGMGELNPNDAGYKMLKDDIESQRGDGFAITKDEYGNKVFGLNSKSVFDDIIYGAKGFNERSTIGWSYLNNDEKNNIARLEEFYQSRPSGLPVVRGGLSTMIGGVFKPMAQGLTGALAGAAVAGPYGAVPGFITGAVSTFALSAPDAVGVRYGDELESRYAEFRNKGLSSNDAYAKANDIAKYAIGGEVALQSAFAVMGGGALPKKALMDPAKKNLFSLNFGKWADNNIAKGALQTAKMAGIGAASTIPSSMRAKQLGSEESAVSKALQTGGDFAAFDAAIRVLTGVIKAPNLFKAQAKIALNSSDKSILNTVVKAGEEAGVYPKGSTRVVY